MKKEDIIKLIEKLSLDEDIEQILSMLANSKDTKDMLSSNKGEHSLLGKLLLCGIGCPDKKKKKRYAQSIAAILKNSPPHCPLEVLSKNMPNTRLTYLAFALDAALKNKDNAILLTQMMRYYSLNKEALAGKKAAQAYLMLFANSLKKAIEDIDADTVESLLSVMSAGLEVEEMTVLSCVLDKMVNFNPSRPWSIPPLYALLQKVSTDSYAFPGYKCIYMSEGKMEQPLPNLPNQAIGFHRKTDAKGKQRYCIYWLFKKQENHHIRLKARVSSNSLPTILTICGKQYTVLEHLNALKPGDSLESIELLDFFLDIGRGCFLDMEERLSRLFLAMLEKIDLFPQMLLNFFLQKDCKLLTDILAFKTHRVDVTIPQLGDEQMEKIHAKYSLSIRFLTATLCLVFSRPLPKQSLPKLDECLNSISYNCIDRGYAYSNIRGCCVDDVNNACYGKVLLRHWLKNILESSKGVNNQRVQSLIAVLRDYMKPLKYSTDERRKKYTLWLKYVFTEIKNLGGYYIFEAYLPIPPSNKHTIRSTTYWNYVYSERTLLIYALLDNDSAFELIMDQANELALESLLPIRAMTQFLASNNKDNRTRFAAASATGRMLGSHQISVLLDRLCQESSSKVSIHFCSLYLQICCIYGADHRCNETDYQRIFPFHIMAYNCLEHISPAYLKSLSQEYNQFLDCLANAFSTGCSIPISYQSLMIRTFRQSFMIRIHRSPGALEDSFIEWDCSNKTFSFQGIMELFKFAAGCSYFKAIIMENITIQGDANPVFVNMFTYTQHFTDFLVDLSVRDVNGLSDPQLMGLVTWLINSKKELNKDIASFSLVINLNPSDQEKVKEAFPEEVLNDLDIALQRKGETKNATKLDR